MRWALGPVLATTVFQALTSCSRLSVCSVSICWLYECRLGSVDSRVWQSWVFSFRVFSID